MERGSLPPATPLERLDAVELTGPDRHRFLNAYLTSDLRRLTAGAAMPSLFTARDGKVLSPVVVHELGDALLLELPSGRGPVIAEHLARFVIADRVNIARREEGGALVVGDRAVERAGELASRSGGSVAPSCWLDLPAASLWEAPETIDRLLADGDPGAAATLDTLRVRRGDPRFGVDYGPDEYFPAELGNRTADLVSYEKGCYLGQEVIARIRWRGKVQRGPRVLAWRTGERSAAIGRALLFDGRPAGTLTSTATLGGRWLGLAILHLRAGEPGSRLELAGDGGEVEVLGASVDD